MKFTEKVIAYIEITRPLNLFITAAVIFGAAIICYDGIFNFGDVILASLAAMFTAAGGNIINDYFDIGTDFVNRPLRPLPSKRLKPAEARMFYLFLIAASFIAAAYVNIAVFIIVLVTTNVLFFYSLKFKRIPLFGNFVISSITGLTFIYGGAAVYNITPAFIPAVFALLVNFIREIIKDMEDIKGDTATGVKTFPIKYGFKASKNIIFILSAILFIFTLIPFIYKLYSIEYFVLVMVVVNPLLVYINKSIYQDDSPINLKKGSGLLKINMLIGLIAIVIGR